MTTNDQAIGRPAATRRPLPGVLSSVRLFGCLLLCGAAMPVFAQQAAPVAEAASLGAASVNSANAPLPATISLSTPAISDAMPLPDRAILFAGDINRLIGSQPVAPDSAAKPAPSTRIQSLLQHALALLGTPYRWGGTGTDGFDCSGLVGYVFRSALGIELPRVSREMATSGQRITDRASLSPGDLVFFGVHHGRRVDHVGIYMGDGRFLHAPRTGRDVTVSTLDGYWGGKFVEARRVAGL